MAFKNSKYMQVKVFDWTINDFIFSNEEAYTDLTVKTFAWFNENFLQQICDELGEEWYVDTLETIVFSPSVTWENVPVIKNHNWHDDWSLIIWRDEQTRNQGGYFRFALCICGSLIKINASGGSNWTINPGNISLSSDTILLTNKLYLRTYKKDNNKIILNFIITNNSNTGISRDVRLGNSFCFWESNIKDIIYRWYSSSNLYCYNLSYPFPNAIISMNNVLCNNNNTYNKVNLGLDIVDGPANTHLEDQYFTDLYHCYNWPSVQGAPPELFTFNNKVYLCPSTNGNYWVEGPFIDVTGMED